MKKHVNTDARRRSATPDTPDVQAQSISLEAFREGFLSRWFTAPIEVADGDTYTCPKAAAERACYEAAVKQAKRGTILILAEDAGSARSCINHLVSFFTDVPELCSMMHNQRSDEVVLHNGRKVIATSMPRSPQNLLLTLKLTGAVEATALPDWDAHEIWRRLRHTEYLEPGLLRARATDSEQLDLVEIIERQDAQGRAREELEAAMPARSHSAAMAGTDSPVPSAYAPRPLRPKLTDEGYYTPEWEAERVERITRIKPAPPTVIRGRHSARFTRTR